eukprot:40688-Eustigmatos_ZCMA.PRE.1
MLIRGARVRIHDPLPCTSCRRTVSKASARSGSAWSRRRDVHRTQSSERGVEVVFGLPLGF